MGFVTYPPQQPGQSSYQGLGTYSGGPKKKNTGRIVAIIAIVAIVLGGGGVATYFLTRGDDNPSSERSNDSASDDTGSDDGSSDSSADTSSDRDQNNAGSDASNSPDDVRDDYMAAYENKDFGDVVTNACAAYKKKFGVDTSSLENDLADFDITAIPDGDIEVDEQNPDTATAKIDLTLVGEEETHEPKILIKIVEESGKWRFCGEEKA
jgi:hypothetical protein